MIRMVLMGPPGSGKGTQAARISARFGVPSISTGDIFRQNMTDLTPLGIGSKKYIDNGDFVPDGLTNRMVRDRLGHPDVANGFLLDGYPRTTAQIAELDDIVAHANHCLDAALLLTANDEELVTRLLDRAKLSGRSDDTELVIRHRLELYRQQTEPVAEIYDARGILLTVRGDGGIDEVTDRIATQIDNLLISSAAR